MCAHKYVPSVYVCLFVVCVCVASVQRYFVCMSVCMYVMLYVNRLQD